MVSQLFSFWNAFIEHVMKVIRMCIDLMEVTPKPIELYQFGDEGEEDDLEPQMFSVRLNWNN